MPRTRSFPTKRIPHNPEAQDSDIEFVPAGASIRSSQPGSARRAPKPPPETPSKRKPALEVPETPSKRRCRSSSTDPEEDGDLPFYPKLKSQTKKNQRQEDVHNLDEWDIPLSESGGMMDEDQDMADTESRNSGRGGDATDSQGEREEEYERDKQYREELKRKASERRDLEFKTKGKVQTSLRTYATRTVRKDLSTPRTLLQKRDPMRSGSTGAIEINDGDDTGGDDQEQDVELQEALRRSLRDTGRGPPRYKQLEPENSKTQPVTKPKHPSLPAPREVLTIGKANALAFLGITLEIVNVPLHPAAPKAKVMTVRFPLSLVGKNDLFHCVSTHGTSILFVWNKGAAHGMQNEAIDLENLHLNTQSLPVVRKSLLDGEGMGKIEIPEGYNIMRTTEQIKCCDTGSGFSTREYLIGISREREQKQGEGAWVVVRVGVVPNHPRKGKGKAVVMVDCDLDGDEMVGRVAPRLLVPPVTSTKLHGGRWAISPALLGEESSDLPVAKPVSFVAKTVRLSGLDLQKGGPEVGAEIPRSYKSLGEAIAEEEENTEGEDIAREEGLSSLSERIWKRRDPGKDRLLGGRYDNGLGGMEARAKKLKVIPKERRAVGGSQGNEGRAPPMDPFISTSGGNPEKQRGTVVLGRHPKVVIPVQGMFQGGLNVEEEVQRRGGEGTTGKLAKCAQKVLAPGPGGVRGGTCVKRMANIVLDGEDAFGVKGGDLYVPKTP